VFDVAALYHFTRIADPAAVQADLRARGDALGIIGTLLIAPEGINGTIAAPTGTTLQAYTHHIVQEFGINPDDIKWSTAAEKPFGKFKVRLKREIITLNQPEANPSEACGVYVEPQDWNDLIKKPDILLLDTRNRYEIDEGTFEGAIDPGINVFSAFATYVDQHLDPEKTPNVAMFCTGGIRCEKASSYMIKKGFKNVYHLHGGILRYLEQIPSEQSLWRGTCFVFDERETLAHGLIEETSVGTRGR
jgi:UPF0176 protein